MKITTITILIAACACLGIWHSLRLLKQDRVGIASALTWSVMLLFIGLAALFPEAMDFFARLAMMENRMFFIIVVALLIIFAMLFYLMFKFEEMERRQARSIQTLAILQHQLDQLRGDRADPAADPEAQARQSD